MRKRRKRCPRPEHIPPTPQTVRKLRRDVIAELVDRGALDPQHGRAADEIHDVWRAFGRGLFPSARPLDGVRIKARYRTPLDRMTEREELIWRTRYRPWADQEGRVRVGETTRLELVIAFVLDNLGPRQVELRYELRHGSAAGHLRQALHHYGELAPRSWRA